MQNYSLKKIGWLISGAEHRYAKWSPNDSETGFTYLNHSHIELIIKVPITSVNNNVPRPTFKQKAGKV